jgi:hypothetical protein
MSNFSQRNILENFWTCSVRGGFTFCSIFFILFCYIEATCGSKRSYKLKPKLEHLNAKFRSVYTQECEPLMICGRDVCCRRYTTLNYMKPNLVIYGILLFALGRYCFWWVPKKWAVCLKSGSVANGSSTEWGLPCIMGSWFSSPDLFHKLCSNRQGVPAEVKSTELKRGNVFQSTTTN